MKKSYTGVDIEIISLKSPDIITASGGDTWLGNDYKPSYDLDGWT